VYVRATLTLLVAVLFLFSVTGCATTDGSNSGWVVVDQPSSSPPHKTQKKPPRGKQDNNGQQVAARNHLQSAYRFLQKNKPDHAMRELDKARNKMGQNYWFHYYYGGAFYLKGMFVQARDRWENAYRYTDDYPMRSRIRTCQSFAIYYLDGRRSSEAVLEKAINMDRKNRTAFDLFQDLRGSDAYTSYDQQGSSKSSGSPYVQEKLGQKGSPEGDNETYREDNGKDNGRHGNGDKKKDKNKGKKQDKMKGKKYKIQDDEQFRMYFMVEMP